MNLFMIDPTFSESAARLVELDPRRARCQLKECAQVLACVEALMTGACTMRKSDNQAYRPTLAQLHHPICVAGLLSPAMRGLAYQLARALAFHYPAHASWASIQAWSPTFSVEDFSGPYLVVRRGRPHIMTHDIRIYADLMGQYVMAKLQRERAGQAEQAGHEA
jgi:hypothetical protein